jgi:ParB family chromosome partitioning protein
MSELAVATEKKDEKAEKRKALGRGLASLLPGPRVVAPASSPAPVSDGGGEKQLPPFVRNGNAGAATTASVEMDATRTGVSAPHDTAPHETPSQHAITFLSVDLIDKNPYQTRAFFDEAMLTELADSIRENGVVQPVVVRPGEGGRYVLVLGERRLRASKMAGKDTIPAIVRRLSTQQAAEMTVLENVQREDLNPIEQAEAFRVLSREFQLTQAQIAERIGVSREKVANYMRLLKLPREVAKYMLDGRLSFSDAREILALDSEEHMRLVADEVVNKHLKWDEIQRRVRELNGFPGLEAAESKKEGTARWMDPNVRAAQTDMERTLGMRVRIKDRNGKGRIVIEYASVDEYERVVEMLRGK